MNLVVFPDGRSDAAKQPTVEELQKQLAAASATIAGLESGKVLTPRQKEIRRRMELSGGALGVAQATFAVDCQIANDARMAREKRIKALATEKGIHYREAAALLAEQEAAQQPRPAVQS